MNLENLDLNREEKSLLIFLESGAVEYGGRVDSRCMNKEDLGIAKKWSENGFINFGRIYSKDISAHKTHWVVLSSTAWTLAHKERIERCRRIFGKRDWKKTTEK